MELLQEIIFVLTPDDRNRWILGYAPRPVAGGANQQLGAVFSLPGRYDALRDPGGPLSGICRRGQNDQNDQSAENSRKVIVDHTSSSHCSTARVSVTRLMRGKYITCRGQACRTSCSSIARKAAVGLQNDPLSGKQENASFDTLTILLDTTRLCWRRPLSQGKAQNRKFGITGGNHGI